MSQEMVPVGDQGRKDIPIEAIIDLKSKNYSNSQIASLLKCSPSNITRRLQDVDVVKQYVNHRPFILQQIQRKIINYISDAKLQKANPYQLALMYGIFYDKERLETGQSTQNIAYADIIAAQAKAKAGLDDLIAEQERRAKLCATECQTL